MRNLILWGLTLALVLSACETGEKKSARITQYFDLISLLDQQAQLLYDAGARVEKELMANGELEQLLITPDSAGQLKAELKLFYDADINKLGLGDAYDTEELPGINGGRKVINSAKKAGPNVRLIERDYQGENLKQIRILVEDKNDIYTFEKEMLMDFEVVNGQAMLKTYSIVGKQDMVMKSELNFSLTGKLLLNP